VGFKWKSNINIKSSTHGTLMTEGEFIVLSNGSKNNKYDSKDEYQFSLWLDEALEKGLIFSWKKCEKGDDTIEIIPKKIYQKRKVKKTKVIWKDAFLLHPLRYTPDFVVRFTNKELLKLFPHSEVMSHNYYEAVIDIKSSVGNKYGNNQSATTFPIIQKVLYHLKGLFVHNIVCNKLFRKSWCPEEIYWMKNRKKPTKTKIGKKSMLIDEYMKNNNILEVIDGRVVEVNNMIRNLNV
jgi:hypothetical protein